MIGLGISPSTAFIRNKDYKYLNLLGLLRRMIVEKMIKL